MLSALISNLITLELQILHIDPKNMDSLFRETPAPKKKLIKNFENCIERDLVRFTSLYSKCVGL